ncbi:MAG TPA: hypothetical protein VHO95_10340, partial [Candidatus Dormibacteraeota bacterium]|nr:hypothetical protein [Candidatus Dormibacteraeota bacterium]
MLYRLSYVGGGSTTDFICSILAPNLTAAIDGVLEKARRRLKRVTPEQAAAEHAYGALLVDTRTVHQRQTDGQIPGALVIDRTVLEWRLDPTCPSRIDEAKDHNVRV